MGLTRPLERTATRRMFAFWIINTALAEAALAVGSGRSASSR